ncbi:MAG: rhomboid family intramembrane serine protease [Nannocystales bacterium]
MAPADQYLRAVEYLLDEGVAGRSLLHFNETAAFLAMEDTSLAIVIHPTKRGSDLLDTMTKHLGMNPKAHHKLIMVGGGEEMRPLLEACQPGVFARRMVQVYHLADDGTIWNGRSSRLDSSAGRALEAGRDGEGVVDADTLARQVQQPSRDEVVRVREHRTFVDAYKRARPVLTMGAVALLLGVYGLQMTWGGGAFIPTLTRMGANTEASLGAEPWRLLASTVLHGGPVHVLMNGVVLYILGGQLERILGWRRLAVLLVSAGLLGAVASSLAAEAMLSVGASGAIWGLFGAALGISVRPQGLVPAAVVGNLKRAAVINLVINLTASFIPGIDLMAHLGGGVAGLLLSFSGVLTRGLRPLSEDPERTADARSGWTLAAWVASAATLASLVVACVLGRPWELGRAPQLARTALEGTRYSVMTVGAPVESERVEGEELVFSIGDPLSDPFTLGVDVHLWAEPGPFEETDINAWRSLDPELPEGVTLVSSDRVAGGDAPVVDEVHAYPNNGLLYVRYTLLDEAEVGVSAFVFEGARDDVTAAAKKSVRSLRVESSSPSH